MFGSTILDIAVGLVFTFLAVSLAASALTETFGSLVKLRQRTLLSGIQALVNDPGFNALARDLYNHALINPLAAGTAAKVSELTGTPAYIDSKQFAVALLDVLGHGQAEGSLATMVAGIPNQQLQRTLMALLFEAEGDRDAFLAGIGRWFDGSMDRLSGWYKRYTQVASFVAALLVAIVLNANAIHIVDTLWKRPALAAELSATVGSQSPTAAAALAALNSTSLLGWSSGTFIDPRTDVSGFLGLLLGWCIVACAALFGAPFWFDTLQRIAQIKGTGPNANDIKPNGGKA